jgi:hypothetical protein
MFFFSKKYLQPIKVLLVLVVKQSKDIAIQQQ